MALSSAQLRGILVFAAVLLVAIVAYAAYSLLTVRPLSEDPSLSGISLPPGFAIYTYADLANGTLSLPGPNPGPRMMLVRGNTLLVSVPSQGTVIALRDMNNDGKADNATAFIGGLDQPHGLDYSDGWYYIAANDEAVRVRDDNGDFVADAGTLQVLTPLPSPGEHVTRTVRVRGAYIYVSIGSTCNVCNEADPERAAIIRCGTDGSNCSVYARGLRNSVGLTLRPETDELFATENGRDFLGDNLPPDEINLIEEGKNYGWPICYGKNVHDTDFDKNIYIRNPCMEPFETPSRVDLQAHSAPLGLVFYNGTAFPSSYAGKLFVAFHGSWNRVVPTGYKVVTVDADTGAVTDFATGWLNGSSVSGRPVDVAVAPDGSLFVSDDAAGKIYRIYYKG